jgi:hypothetical protein
MTRRGLLKIGLVTACSCFFPCAVVAGTDSYYVKNRQQFLSEFDGMCHAVEQYLVPIIGLDKARETANFSKEAFARLLPGLPDVGGESNRNQINVLQAGWLAAIFTGMKKQGLSAEAAGRLFYDLCESDLKATSVEKLRAEGEAYFSSENYEYLRNWAHWTQKRTYPGDWVAKVVFGNGEDFDVGHDYSECGAVKYFKSQNMSAIAPYFCLADFSYSRYQHTGLARSMTIAQGDPICNFRYKRGRIVTQNWDTETPRFKL